MLLNIAQGHPRGQSFDFLANCGGSGAGSTRLKGRITCDATDMPPSRGESAVLRR